MSAPRRLAYYVTGHGFGHATRTSALLRALFAAADARGLAVEVELSTSLPAWVWRELRPWASRLHVRARTNDVGLLQSDGLALDLPATVRALTAHLDGLEVEASAEAAHLRATGAELVCADIPAAPLRAAALAGLPSAAVGNFDWAFIYAGYVDLDPVFARAVERFREIYAGTGALYRLPFSPPMELFPRRIDTPLLVRRPERGRDEVRRAIGLADDPRPLVLLTFGGLSVGSLGLGGFDEPVLAPLDDLVFLTFGDGTPALPNVRRVAHDAFHFPNLVAAADAIVTKLGYGIVSEAVAGRTPLLYVPRPDFPEYPVIAGAVGRFVPSCEVSLDELRAGAFAGPLRALVARPKTPAPIALDGDRFIAEHLLDTLAPA